MRVSTSASGYRSADRFDQGLLGWAYARLRVAIELHVVKAPIVAGFLEQFGVGADLLDVPLIHDDDLIGRQDRRKPVRDRDHGPPGGESFERLLDLLFRFGIER